MEGVSPIIEKSGQERIDFDSLNKLENTLKSIVSKYPLIEKIIKDRISYNGERFIIGDVQMTEEELMKKMYELDRYESQKRQEVIKREKEDDLGYLKGYY